MRRLSDWIRTRPALVLEARQIFLRTALLSDYAAWRDLREASREQLAASEPGWRETPLTAGAYRRRLAIHAREIREGSRLPLLIVHSADAKIVGGITLSSIRYGAFCSATVGYWIGAPFQRRGFGRAALCAALAHAFGTLGLNRVEAACLASNHASLALLRGRGFREEGTARQCLHVDGAWRDHLVLALTAEDYSALRKGN